MQTTPLPARANWPAGQGNRGKIWHVYVLGAVAKLRVCPLLSSLRPFLVIISQADVWTRSYNASGLDGLDKLRSLDSRGCCGRGIRLQRFAQIERFSPSLRLLMKPMRLWDHFFFFFLVHHYCLSYFNNSSPCGSFWLFGGVLSLNKTHLISLSLHRNEVFFFFFV